MGAGAVSIFTKTGATWGQQALLTPNFQINWKNFGAAISLNYDGTVCAIGTFDNTPLDEPDSAYVFVKSGGVWSQQKKIDPPNGVQTGNFGRFLSISGDGNTLAVSTVGNNSSPTMPCIYVRSGSDWNLQSFLGVNNGSNNGNVGWDITLSSDGNTCAFLDHGPNAGMFLFERTGSTWTQTAKILTSGDPYHSHMSRDGTACIVGSPYSTGNYGQSSGVAHVSVKRNGVWTTPIELQPSDGQSLDYFGRSVLLNGDGTAAFIGSNNRVGSLEPAVYVFV